MLRRSSLVRLVTLGSLAAALVVAAGCKDTKEKLGAVADKADKAIDKLDLDEAAEHLASAKAKLASGLEAVEDCSWAATVAVDAAKEAARAPIAELRQLCSFDAPLGRATRAVTKAEAARAEQPEAPSLTECSSDEWAVAKPRLERDHAGEPRWTAPQARWAKVCPGS